MLMLSFLLLVLHVMHITTQINKQPYYFQLMPSKKKLNLVFLYKSVIIEMSFSKSVGLKEISF